MSGWGSNRGAEDLANIAMLGLVFLVAGIVELFVMIFNFFGD